MNAAHCTWEQHYPDASPHTVFAALLAVLPALGGALLGVEGFGAALTCSVADQRPPSGWRAKVGNHAKGGSSLVLMCTLGTNAVDSARPGRGEQFERTARRVLNDVSGHMDALNL
jgi:hypothetical protein